MTVYDNFFSRAAAGMQESAIRKTGSILAQHRNIISFAPGYPAPETFAWRDFQEIAQELLSGADGHVLQYGPTRGNRRLLEEIARIMQNRGVAPAVDRLMVTTGSQQGLDLVARVLLDPGDVVLVELPTYTGAIMAFRNAQAQLEGVPQEADGIDLAALDDTHARLVKHGKRVPFVYVVPNFQNPTGLLISLDKRRKLLDWASKRDVLIVEDDPYRELYFEDCTTEADVRPMKADDAEGRVIYLSSFSKTLAPGFRIAWIDAPAPLAVKLEMAKQAGDLCSSILDQRIVYEAARRGILERQLPMLRRYYQDKRDVLIKALKQALGDDIHGPDPRGGFFLWATLPQAIDADHMLQRAVEHGVVYVAGSAFFVNNGGRNLIRLSFSAPSHELLREGAARLAATIREEQSQAVPAAPEPRASSRR